MSTTRCVCCLLLLQLPLPLLAPGTLETDPGVNHRQTAGWYGSAAPWNSVSRDVSVEQRKRKLPGQRNGSYRGQRPGVCLEMVGWQIWVEIELGGQEAGTSHIGELFLYPWRLEGGQCHIIRGRSQPRSQSGQDRRAGGHWS